MEFRLPSSGFQWLMSPHSHYPALARRRASVILHRVRLFSLVFAMLTPLWCVVDYAAFPLPVCQALAKLRLVASAGFVFLWVCARHSGGLGHAYRALSGLFAIPLIFILIAHGTLAAYNVPGISLAVGSGYAFVPFLLIAGLSIFPLTLVESLVLASPMLLAQGLGEFLHGDGHGWANLDGAGWWLALIAATSALVGLGQLTSLIGRRRADSRERAG